jgi:hypothetical protein
LVHFGFACVALEIYQLLNAVLSENVVTTTCALIEPKPAKQTAEIIEINVCIRLTLQNPKPEFLIFAHGR